MLTTVRVQDFSSCCRCCLKKVGTMTPIFTGCLNTMFNDVIRLQISQNDGYPQQMCSRCIVKLSTAHYFYLMVLNSHKALEVALKEGASQETSEELNSNLNTEVVVKNEPIQFTNSNECEAETVKSEPKIEPSYQRLTFKESSEELSDSEDAYQCPQCDHRSSTQEDLTTHLETHLVGRDTVPKVLPKPFHLCIHCGKRFCLRTSLAKHMRLHRGNFFQCMYCDKKFLEASTLKVHLVSHNLVNPKPFRCSVCAKSFSQKSSLKTHEKGHYSTAIYQCANCQKSFRHSRSLRNHFLREHETLQCKLCPINFVGKKALDVHLRLHGPPKLSFKRKTIINQGANQTIDQVDVESVKVEFLCMLCVQTFQSKESLETHLCSRANVS